MKIRTRAALPALALALCAVSAPAPAVAGTAAGVTAQATADATRGATAQATDGARTGTTALADKARSGRPAPCSGEYQGDARLGPAYLPSTGEWPVGPLLRGYQRTGDLSPGAFLAKYWKEESPQEPGGWKYPPNDGFAEVNGEIDKHVENLRSGEELDRFGSEYGSYLAPAGDLYAERALPPQNLNTRDAAYRCDYHRYTVKRTFAVWQGSIAPWFEQRGGGQQIKLDPQLLTPGEGERLNVKWLLDHDYLDAVAAG